MLLMLISHEEKKTFYCTPTIDLLFSCGPCDELNILNNSPPANAVQIILDVFLIIYI